jgi:hypothetical protein
MIPICHSDSGNSKKRSFFMMFLKTVLFFALFLHGGEYLPGSKKLSAACPPEYGKILFPDHSRQGKHLFTIGMGHRDALTGANGRRTAKIQAEVYKLGEWLIRHEGVRLILPEGFFSRPGLPKTPNLPLPDSERWKSGELPDLKTLEAKLADPRAFINAEILLKRNYPVILRQVEDKACYQEVGALIRKLSGGGCSLDERAKIRAELDSLQDKRTAPMLQRIPEIIDKESEEGGVKTRKAIFTMKITCPWESITKSEILPRYSPLGLKTCVPVRLVKAESLPMLIAIASPAKAFVTKNPKAKTAAIHKPLILAVPIHSFQRALIPAPPF